MIDYKEEIIMDFKRAGLIYAAKSGKHDIYRHPNGRAIIVPSKIKTKAEYRNAFKAAKL